MLWAIAPVVIDTQNMFHTCHLPQRGYLRYICPFFVYHFLCPSISGKPLTFSHEILYKIFHAPLYWEGVFWLILRPILAYVPLFLENSSVCSHEILFRFFWYYSDGHYTKISPSYPSVLGVILGYFGAHLGICSSTYRELFNIFLWNFIEMFPSCPLCWGSFWGTFGPILSMFLHVLRSSQNFLVMFCAELLGTTQMVTNQKIYIGSPLIGTSGAILVHFGVCFSSIKEQYNICALIIVHRLFLKH